MYEPKSKSESSRFLEAIFVMLLSKSTSDGFNTRDQENLDYARVSFQVLAQRFVAPKKHVSKLITR